MQDDEFTSRALATSIRLGLIALLVIWCFHIVQPFVVPILWGIIIAVAIFPIYRALRALVGGRAGIGAAMVTLALLLIMVLPIVLLVSMLAENLHALSQQLRDGTLRVPPTPPTVSTWPLIGVPVAKFWDLAAGNLSAAIQQLAPQLKEFATPLLAAAAAVGLSMLEFVVAAFVAGVFLAYSEEGHRFSRAVGRRLAGEHGVELVDLGEATMRSVARGVLGVALIQAFLAGLGMVVVGIPFAGLWTVIALVLGVLQVGVGLVLVPAVIYVFSTHDITPAVLFLIWSVLVTFVDNVLKPLLLGRGLDVPLVVIFMGAIGGMLSSGFIGLFVGAVVLALGYKIFLAWLEQEAVTTEAGPQQTLEAPRVVTTFVKEQPANH